jgi:hypothetical protein
LQAARLSSGSASAGDDPRPASVAAPPNAAAASLMAVRAVHTVAIVEPKSAPEPAAASVEAAGLEASLRPTLGAEVPPASDSAVRTLDPPAEASPVSLPAPAAPMAVASRTEQESEPRSDQPFVAARTPARLVQPAGHEFGGSGVSRKNGAPRAKLRRTRLAKNEVSARAAAPVQAAPGSAATTTSPPRWRTLSDLFGR